MKNKRNKRIIAIILALLMALTLVIGVVSSMTARATVTQSQINRLRDQQRDIRRQMQEAQAQINSLAFERLEALAQKSVLDDRIALTIMEIDLINETIDQLIILLEEKELEVIEAETREDIQLQRYRTRVRDMEENGVITYLDIIFNAASFSDLLARIDFVTEIMRADETLYQNLVTARLETIAAKERLEETKEELEEELILLEIREAELLERLEEAEALIRRIQSDFDAVTALHETYASEAERVQREINEAVAELERQEAARRAAEAARGGSSGGSGRSNWATGDLTWPVPSSSAVSSYFGVRRHPVFGTNRMHNGIDIPARHGSNVVAAAEGTVIISTYNSSFGNYIVISHGGGLTTLYAHLSSRSVSRNDTVTRGQVIGRVGSTGVSTGPHLHFETSLNGTRVNPLNYFERAR